MSRKRPKRGPTMDDVAALAGVSQTTVSYVVNNVPHASIPEETRARIWAAVKELGYRPNALAQSLRTSRSQLIGFIADEIATTPFAGNVIKGAQEAAWDKDKILLVVNTDGSADLEAAAIERLLQHQVEGIIYAAMYHRQVHPPESIRHVPTVLVDCYADDKSFPSVVPNEVQGGMAATRALLAAGHRRIGFVNNVDSIPARYGRLEGYKQALEGCGVARDHDLIVYHKPTPQGGYEGTRELLRRADRPTAIFCFNDRMALGAYNASRELGLRVPHDLSVVGFDNQEIIAASLLPPLSTVALPHYEMGRWAIQQVEKRIAGEEPEPVQHVIDCPLVERESIAAPRAD